MASNLSVTIPASKITNASSTPSAPAVHPSVSSLSAEASGHRRGGSGNHGAGSSTRTSGGQPRKQQGSRNQNKPSRRPKLVDEDAIAETAAMRSTSSRKGQTSITHLMNFSLPPRPSHFHHTNHRRGPRRNPTWGLGSGYHATDKARYVHANYRFIVDPRQDYRAQSVDADTYLDWGNILQILASPQSQEAACPICLGDPVAPRMAKCGHIFCLHCLIRYMHSDDEQQPPEKRARWKKCPICWDSIYISETRPVRWYIGQERSAPHEGEDIVLRLVVRPAGKTLALPRESSSMLNEQDIPWHFAADVMDFARVMKGTEDYMNGQYDVEIAEIEQVERHDELMFGEDTEWTGRAKRSIEEARNKIKGIGGPTSDGKTPLKAIVPDSWLDAESNDSSSSGSTQPTATPSALSTSLAQFRNQTNPLAPSDYYFYQALLHYYLSPLDIRILKAAFGEYATFPSTILPRVQRVSTGHVVDDDLRKRAKYLAHLPHGCEVSFLECDWTDTVPSDVLDLFKTEIERRRKKNLDKETREEKERQRAEKEEEDRRYAALRRRRPASPVQQFQPADFQPLVPDSADSGEPSSPPWPAWRQNGSPFASLGSPSTSPNVPRTVWGTAAVPPASPLLQPAPQEVAPPDDGWLQGWEKDLMEDSIVAQTQALSLAESSKSGGTTSKKKKGKKITLMTTNTRRGA